MDVILDLPDLDILGRAEARLALHRIIQLGYPSISTIIMGVDLLIQMGSPVLDICVPPKKNFEIILNLSAISKKNHFPSNGLVFYKTQEWLKFIIG